MPCLIFLVYVYSIHIDLYMCVCMCVCICVYVCASAVCVDNDILTNLRTEQCGVSLCGGGRQAIWSQKSAWPPLGGCKDGRAGHARAAIGLLGAGPRPHPIIVAPFMPFIKAVRCVFGVVAALHIP